MCVICNNLLRAHQCIVNPFYSRIQYIIVQFIKSYQQFKQNRSCRLQCFKQKGHPNDRSAFIQCYPGAIVLVNRDTTYERQNTINSRYFYTAFFGC